MEIRPRAEDKDEVGHYHGHDEEDEETVVVPSHTPIEKEAVVVVVFNAHVTQTAVFAVVHLDQLEVHDFGFLCMIFNCLFN